jgi:hypothetical protein
MHRFADGFPAVAFDPYALHIEATGITHADGGKTFRFVLVKGNPGAITEQGIGVIGQRW